MDETRSTGDRRIVHLLTALVALTGVLVVALCAGGALAWHEYGKVRGALGVARDGGARDLVAEVSQRQEAISAQLASSARDAARQIELFEHRAERLRNQGGGPVESAKRALEMTQLMADEMLLQLKLMTTLDSALEKTSRPLPQQQTLLRARHPDRAADHR